MAHSERQTKQKPHAKRGARKASQPRQPTRSPKRTVSKSKPRSGKAPSTSKPNTKNHTTARARAHAPAVDYDVVIVGAGPAGMFAANELKRDFSVAVIDMGVDVKRRKCRIEDVGHCTNCPVCHIMCGVGGAGTFSDGILNLRPDIGGDIAALTGDEKEAWRLVDYVDDIFVKCGSPKRLYKTDAGKTEALKRNAARAGVMFQQIPQRHIGSDKSPAVIDAFAMKLRRGGVKFILKKRVTELKVKNGTYAGVILDDGTTITSKYIVIAAGRVGASQIEKAITKHNVEREYLPIDLGVRVEVPSIIMDPIIDVSRDPKFYIRTKTYDDAVRTFCTNHEGFVVKENYNGYVGVNGHSMHKSKSQNTNFAFLVTVGLTEPVENTIDYGKSIAEIATTIGGNKPTIQRLGDLRAGRRSTAHRLERNAFSPTFKDATPGDLSMVFPHRVVTNLLEGLEMLNGVIPGVTSDSTLLYGPEIKYYAVRPKMTKNLEIISLRNAFAAGDGLGLSRGIIGAAVTGVLAAQGIIKKAQRAT